MPITIGQTRMTRDHWSAASGQTGAVIQRDDPDYMPGSPRPVRNRAQTLSELMDEIPINAPEIQHLSWAEPRGAVRPRQGSAEARFSTLADAWRRETRFCSTLLEIVTNPNYQQIIGMGRSAIPFILVALAKEPGHWFWALKAITTEDPVAEPDRGDLDRMTQAWLVWGARNGYVF